MTVLLERHPFNFSIEQNLNFEVSARPIRISFAGNLSADGGPIILSEQNGDNPGFTVTNLPENYLFGSSLKLKSLEGMEVKDRFIVTGPYQNNPQFDYFTWLTDSVETEDPKITDSSLNADLLTNYNITLQIDLIVQGSTIPYSIEKYEGEYDELEHSITFKVLTNVPYQILGYVVNGNTASVLTNLPRYKNFTNGQCGQFWTCGKRFRTWKH